MMSVIDRWLQWQFSHDHSVTGENFLYSQLRKVISALPHYYAALLRRRGPHIASHSVCPSVCLSVCPSVRLSVRPVIIDNLYSPA